MFRQLSLVLVRFVRRISTLGKAHTAVPNPRHLADALPEPCPGVMMVLVEASNTWLPDLLVAIDEALKVVVYHLAKYPPQL